MNPKKDAYGQQVWAYFNGEKSFEVVERDDGFVDVGMGATAYFQEYNNWPWYQKEAIKFAKGNVLDVGTGAGRVSLYLQKQAHNVTAIDSSPLAIKLCKKRGIKNVRVLPFAQIGILKLNTFNTVVMFGNNFGLFGSFKQARTLLKELCKITTKDALIIAETNDPYKTKDPLHLKYHHFNRRRGRMSGQLRIRIRFRQYTSDWFDYLIVSEKEMKEIVQGTGWKVKKFVNPGESPYIAILQKKHKQDRCYLTSCIS